MNDRKDNHDALKEKFRRDGYVLLPEFLAGEDLERLRGNLEYFINHRLASLPDKHVFYEEKGRPETLKQIQRMSDYDPWFHDLMFQGRFQALSDTLIGDGSVGKNLQFFNKPPGASRPTPPHQDGYYFMLEPCEAITMWLALDNVDEENGCVRYIPGSHQRGMRPHCLTQTLGFSQGISDYGDTDRAQEFFTPVQPGDLLVHHALTIHRADSNQSDRRNRRALGFIYYSKDAIADELAHAAYQKKLAQDLAAQGKI